MNRSLYKFCPPARTDILENNLIRFSPLSDFNDPFDGNPHLSPFDPTVPLSAEELASLRKVVHRVEPDLPDQEILARLSKIERTPESDRKTIESMRALMREMGVLCLTSNCEEFGSALMWAHYSECHTGLMIEFNSDTAFFPKEWNNFGQTRSPCEISYQPQRPSLRAGQILNQGRTLFFTKSSDWAYEKEIRVLMPLTQADKPAKHLFSIPPESFKRVVIGCKAEKDLEDKVVRISREPRYRNLKVEKAVLDEKSYKLLFRPI